MSLFKNELDLARYLRDALEEKQIYRKIYVNTNLASHKFYDHWMEWWKSSLPPAQPQIDILFVDNSLQLRAAELKYFRMTVKGKSKKENINYPFYKGIEEALALLRFGFECVCLWHFYDEKVPEEMISRYQTATSKITNELKLPINYAGYYLDRNERGVQPHYIQYGYYSKQAISFPSPYGQSNPFKDQTDAKKVLDFLRIFLRIPRK